MASPSRFSEIILSHAPPVAPGSPCLAVEPLAHLDYARELELKNQALQEFWDRHALPLQPLPVAPSPRPRHYRTTTRRHAGYERGRVRLTADPGGSPGRRAAASLLEPPEHAALYAFIGERLQESHFRPLAEALHFVIVRGSYRERCVIFNVSRLDAAIVRKLKLLMPSLPEVDRAVVSAFVFLDPTRSAYYLDTGAVPGSVKVKKLFGPDVLVVEFAGLRYLYYPTGFTQVNESMVPTMLATARELLTPGGEREHLVDLYCGYGLFSHYLAASYSHVCGLDAAPESIAAAQRNARFQATTNRVTFRVCRIDGEAFTRYLPRPDEHAEVVLTDPPRQGMTPAVIAALARRAPVRVVQACCGTDEIPLQIRAWHEHGYAVRAIRPLDMFAGTPHLETLLLLEPAAPRGRSRSAAATIPTGTGGPHGVHPGQPPL